MRNKLKIWIIKRKARYHYKAYYNQFDLDCGFSMTLALRACSIKYHADSFNNLLDILKKIDDAAKNISYLHNGDQY